MTMCRIFTATILLVPFLTLRPISGWSSTVFIALVIIFIILILLFFPSRGHFPASNLDNSKRESSLVAMVRILPQPITSYRCHYPGNVSDANDPTPRLRVVIGPICFIRALFPLSIQKTQTGIWHWKSLSSGFIILTESGMALVNMNK